MSRDYTLRILQSTADRTKNNRKKNKKAGSAAPKSMKKLRPPKNYDKVK